MKPYFMKFVAQLLIPLLVLLNTSPWVVAADNAPLSDTKITHQPLDSVPAGIAFPVSATVKDSAGIEVVRAYFKSTVGTIYYYIPMAPGKDNTYSGRLPAPAIDAGEIEYLVLVKNKNNVVVKSQHYQTKVVEGKRKTEAQQENIKVFSESPYASKHIIGFTDGYEFQVAEPTEKYGVVAGLYNPEEVSWIATDAVAGGTTAEPPSDTSINPWLIGGAAVAGIAVVALALGGGGGGGGDSEEPPAEEPPDEEPPTEEPPAADNARGTWRLTSYQNTSACTSGVGGTQTVTCSGGNIQSVSPSSVPVSVPDTTSTSDTCINGTTPGLSDIFFAGNACDAVEACNDSSITQKPCGATSITIVRDNGNHRQTWTKQ